MKIGQRVIFCLKCKAAGGQWLFTNGTTCPHEWHDLSELIERMKGR